MTKIINLENGLKVELEETFSIAYLPNSEETIMASRYDDGDWLAWNDSDTYNKVADSAIDAIMEVFNSLIIGSLK